MPFAVLAPLYDTYGLRCYAHAHRQPMRSNVGCVRGVALLPAACGVLYLHILYADLFVIAIASFYQVSCVMCVRHS